MQLNIYRSCFCLLCASSSPSIFIPLGVLGALIFSFQMKIIRENLLLKKSDIFSPDKMSQFCHQVELQHDKMSPDVLSPHVLSDDFCLCAKCVCIRRVPSSG